MILHRVAIVIEIVGTGNGDPISAKKQVNSVTRDADRIPSSQTERARAVVYRVVHPAPRPRAPEGEAERGGLHAAGAECCRFGPSKVAHHETKYVTD